MLFTTTPDPIHTPDLDAGSTRQSEIDGMTMVYIPGGEFLMGSTNANTAASAQEKPQHAVELDAFWIDQTEVTNAMFEKFVNATSYKTEAEQESWGFTWTGRVDGANWQHPQGPDSDLNGLDNHPVVQVSWNDATAYCNWAGRRLPTEAEWEKAARGTDGRKYPWGDGDIAGNLLNFADQNLDVSWANTSIDDGHAFTSPVGSYPAGASPYGVLDMAGNVWEPVGDWYDKAYYTNSPQRNPGGPSSGTDRVTRGGAWGGAARDVSTTYRGWSAPDLRADGQGFRCAQ